MNDPLRPFGHSVTDIAILCSSFLHKLRRHLRSNVERPCTCHATPKHLPAELWLYISGFLPLSTQASLAFSCHSLACVLGATTWRALRSDPEERLTFLKLLDYQLPKHLLCFDCQIYHARAYRMHNRPKGGHSGGFISLSSEIGDLRFADVQLAMRAGRLGAAYGEPMPSLKHLARGRKPKPNYAYRLTTASVDGRLMLRFNAWRRVRCAHDLQDVDELCWNFAKCEHHARSFRDLCHGAIDLAYHFGYSSTLDHCYYCPTDYEITARHED